MTRKRYIRLLMSEGYSRDDARRNARVVVRYNEIAGKHRSGHMRSYAKAKENRLWFAGSLIDYFRKGAKTE